MFIRVVGIVTALVVGGLATDASAQSTSAHAMVVSGLAGHPGGGAFDCATSGPQPGVSARFGTGVGLPTEGYSYCNLAGGIQDRSGSGLSVAHQDVNNSFSNGTHIQSADAIADYGVLKASSSGSYSGDAIGGFSYHAGEAAAVSTDAVPTPGKFVILGFTVHGLASLGGTRTSQALTFFNYQINSGPTTTIFVSNLVGDSASVRGWNGSSFVDLAGFTVVPGSASGSDTVFTFLTELPDAPTFNLTLGLYTASYPAPFGGAANNDFSNTVRLTSFQAFDASRNAIDFGTLVGASGRLYDANGIHAAAVGSVPEPANWALLIAGFGAIGGAARHRRRALGAA